MNARQRLRTCAHNSHSRQQTTSDRYYNTPRDFPVVSIVEALESDTRSDTLFAAANYHARQNNWPIAKRLREVAAAVRVA